LSYVVLAKSLTAYLNQDTIITTGLPMKNRLWKIIFLLLFILPILIPLAAFASNTVPGGGSTNNNVTITVKGPNDEPWNSLPSTQSDYDISYKVTVTGLESRTSYHIKIFRANGWDTTAIENGADPEEAGLKPDGVESVCGASDDYGNLSITYPDGNLPDGKDVTGSFIMEVSTNSGTSSGDKCKRGTYVQSTAITIVTTNKDYGKPSQGSTKLEDKNEPTKDTALGPIPTDVAGFASKFAAIAIGIAGGIAFLLMIYGSFRLVFSNGDVEAVQQGRQIIVAAVTGLIVIIFSIFILRLIGISILGLPI